MKIKNSNVNMDCIYLGNYFNNNSKNKTPWLFLERQEGGETFFQGIFGEMEERSRGYNTFAADKNDPYKFSPTIWWIDLGDSCNFPWKDLLAHIDSVRFISDNFNSVRFKFTKVHKTKKDRRANERN